MDSLIHAAGGLALFLLAMMMLTDGLKIYAGAGLRDFLQKWTSSPLRGVFSGALFTAVVQSSSAVTVTTIGFVNAGLLTMRQALGVIFGANIGTTMTGWLISIVGFGFKIDSLAMPVLVIGVMMQLLSPNKKYKGLGEALTGFGLFFLGLAILQDAFSGVAADVGMSLMAGTGIGGLLLMILFGFIATVLTMSSSAAMALILMAVSQSVIDLDAAAAAIIGANLGTTPKAFLVAIGATPNARRVAVGHAAFNLITGVVALLLLPVMLWLATEASEMIGSGTGAMPVLALFHTVFNVLGVLLLFPFIGKLADFLDGLFKSEAEDMARPQFLDKTILANPALALSALHQELSRINDQTCTLMLAAIKATYSKPRTLMQKADAVFSLAKTAQEFGTSLHMEDMSRDIAELLPDTLRVARYQEEAARLLPDINDLAHGYGALKPAETRHALESFFDSATALVALLREHDESEGAAPHHDKVVVQMDRFQSAYQDAKAALLQAAVAKKLSAAQADRHLDSLSRMRRAIEQLEKSDRLLQGQRFTPVESVRT